VGSADQATCPHAKQVLYIPGVDIGNFASVDGQDGRC
jgi:hypothetical protein